MLNYGLAELKIYDLLGKEIETLVNEELCLGTYLLSWNTSAYPSVVYFYRFDTESFQAQRKWY
jgi:hypothetical protein